jgi:hypothetical protein
MLSKEHQASITNYKLKQLIKPMNLNNKQQIKKRAKPSHIVRKKSLKHLLYMKQQAALFIG